MQDIYGNVSYAPAICFGFCHIADIHTVAFDGTAGIFRNGFRLVVFSVIIMIVVLFFRKGIMGDRELPEQLGKLWKKIRGLFAKKVKTEEVADHE